MVCKKLRQEPWAGRFSLGLYFQTTWSKQGLDPPGVYSSSSCSCQTPAVEPRHQAQGEGSE